MLPSVGLQRLQSPVALDDQRHFFARVMIANRLLQLRATLISSPSILRMISPRRKPAFSAAIPGTIAVDAGERLVAAQPNAQRRVRGELASGHADDAKREGIFGNGTGRGQPATDGGRILVAPGHDRQVLSIDFQDRQIGGLVAGDNLGLAGLRFAGKLTLDSPLQLAGFSHDIAVGTDNGAERRAITVAEDLDGAFGGNADDLAKRVEQRAGQARSF